MDEMEELATQLNNLHNLTSSEILQLKKRLSQCRGADSLDSALFGGPDEDDVPLTGGRDFAASLDFSKETLDRLYGPHGPAQ